jgi:SAM-dependent methyltransferase
MMKCDAVWLGEALARVEARELSPVLNLGSSTREHREVKQPFIHELVFAPLGARGVRVIHADLKAADGVDISGDIFNDADLARLAAYNAKAVICTHMFEHVVDRQELSRRILALIPEGGRFFVTVPSSYHQHNDPIDTMFRPSPAELAALFPGQHIAEASELIGDTYWSHVRKRPVTLFFRHFLRFWVPFLGWRAWRRSMRKLYWLFNHYKVAAIVGRKATAVTPTSAPATPQSAAAE